MMEPETNLFTMQHCSELKPVGTLMFVWPASAGLVLACHPCTERMLAQVPQSMDPHHAQPFSAWVVLASTEVRCGGKVSSVNPADN